MQVFPAATLDLLQVNGRLFIAYACLGAGVLGQTMSRPGNGLRQFSQTGLLHLLLRLKRGDCGIGQLHGLLGQQTLALVFQTGRQLGGSIVQHFGLIEQGLQIGLRQTCRQKRRLIDKPCRSVCLRETRIKIGQRSCIFGQTRLQRLALGLNLRRVVCRVCQLFTHLALSDVGLILCLLQPLLFIIRIAVCEQGLAPAQQLGLRTVQLRQLRRQTIELFTLNRNRFGLMLHITPGHDQGVFKTRFIAFRCQPALTPVVQGLHEQGQISLRQRPHTQGGQRRYHRFTTLADIVLHHVKLVH